MSIFTKIAATALALAATFAVPLSASAAPSRGKVLVVMSSAHQLDLKDGKTYSTGYYLNEFVVPYRKLIEAGYEPVIANPKGDMPVMDANSNNKMFFGGDDAARADALKYAQGIEQLKHPKTLASVVAGGTSGYVGLFIPGGHAPMVDLLKDPNLGKILVSFHETGRPTGIICHGPIVLLSTLSNPDAFISSMIANDGKANSLAAGWPYAGYHLTVFSTGEEEQLEGPAGLGGYVQFYPVNALAEAGAHVESVANWHSNVVVDRELITGQQPMSAPEFGDVLVKQLNAHSH
ncbi:type 1 glutamine amidotransferase domain-containing protein [Paraburkholderia sp. DHOC27]|uniref:type 1 glutamine amidotransferase domain-containing protein n=1 Tax=Paraburkholderia sp. DHOC27 TaxID=2303330 RepID=UPI000E3E11F9|nr:type 1 glutamine amidotransferase domain-containing protein [Paraburkholderia sp. DHOC27]RFU49137.1 type 1 glutamine amidotransferase domain-containing protein [Paraburkholderia sp. DHOC27]